MAVKGGILTATFLSFAILPLLASAFHPHIPVLLPFRSHHQIDESPSHDGEYDMPIDDHPTEGHEKPKFEEGEEEHKEAAPNLNEPGFVSKPVEESGTEPSLEGLREGFYEQSCPQAENVVNEIINKHFRRDPTLAPAFVRLFFHDCFVTGCDASILLDETPSGEDVEKKAPHNGPFVRGFDIIDEIKAQLEAECPGAVSCADVLAFANRDALVYTGVPNYNVAAGRRDGWASLARNVEGNLPLPESTAHEMIDLFQRKGMTLEELVILIGAHSIGTAHCAIVAGRFHDPQKAKEIDHGYLIKMQTLVSCRNDSQDLAFDPYSHHKMDSRFYKELLKNQALLESDHNLAKEPHANNIMKKYADDQKGWSAKFTSTIIKLGQVEVLTGNQGQIRKQCRAVNHALF
ncbi:Peroxidase [Handroanthus impetiginosus]|uniref:Peroxidase n=1 Tax=Handroanthus impetiginosus TaxID=429701 RepID=A0A2G9G3L3_9LAMI|nr:Peroxidase [Handroanthus impetiginosus]